MSQLQLDVAGHNIANVNTPGFSRQRVELTTRAPNIKPYGAVGRGPAIEGIIRLRERFLDETFRKQAPDLGQAEVESLYFDRIEDIFQEPDERGFGSRLNVFFDALNDFANNVEDLPTRAALLEETAAVAASLNDVAQRVDLLRSAANDQVRDEVEQINSLIDRIARQNAAIRDAELTDRTANDLRDERDVLVDELAKITDIVWREREDGQIDINLSGILVVNGGKTERLAAAPDPAIDPDRPDLLGVRFASSGQPVVVTGGELFGALRIRDVELAQLGGRIDELARGLIEGINAVHSQANGLDGYASALRASNGVDDAAAALDAAGLPFDVRDGAFEIVVYDAAGNEVGPRLSIPIVASGPPAGQTTLAGIASAIDASPNLSASVDAEGRLTIAPDAGFTFGFANDTAGALVALGVNGLFSGSRASDIALAQPLHDNPRLLAGRFSTSRLDTGDNTAALAMAAVRTAAVLDGGTQTIDEFYQATVVQVGIDSRANQDLLTVEEAFIADLERRRQEVSGVNLDEEVTQLIQFQRAFEASARIITVTDRMLEALLALGA